MAKQSEASLKSDFGWATSLVVQWLGLSASTARGTDLTPGWGSESYRLYTMAKEQKGLLAGVP